MTHKDDHGQYFTMMLYPPAELKQVQRSPMEMVFVLDCSGSMNGRPLDQARAAVTHALQKLTPRDTFQIIDFSNTASQLGPAPINATPENLRNGLAYLASLNGSGGTEMIEGLKAALDFPHDEGRYRVVSFMTDGYIGNDHDILHAVAQKTGDSRIFSFGVGQSPNRYLMDRMALLGRGAVAYLSLNDDPVQIMEQFHESISHPAMTDLSINWGSMNVTDVYPQIVPDLIVGRPVVLTGRFTGEPGIVTVNGRTGMQPVSYSVALDARDANKEHKGIGAVWARLKIADLMAQVSRTPDQAEQIQQSVLRTALDYSLMSALTAFVAVDSMTKTEGAFGTTVAVPVPVPEGVRYDTAVEN
jgi:Ca-activated chloride channel family protein